MNRSTFLSLLVAPFVLPLLPKEEEIVYGGRWQGEADEPSGIDYEALERDYWYALGRDGGRIPNPKIWETYTDNIPRTYRWDDGKESWEPITS